MTALRVAIYQRVSSAGQAKKQARRDGDDRWTLPAQRKALVSECERRGWEITGEFCDAGISGETLDARPEMMRLLAEVRSGSFDIVLAVEWERFSRSKHGRDWSEILNATESGRARLAVPGQILDPAVPDDGFLAGLFGLLSAREKRKTTERTQRGIKERLESGCVWTSLNPFGFRKSPDGKLVIVPEQAEIVRRIFAEVRAGTAFQRIAIGLNRDGIPTPNGGKEWRPNNVIRMVRNPIYSGAVVYGARSRRKNAQQLRVDGAHPPIVALHEFEQTQSVVAARRSLGYAHSWHGQGYVLTGLLRCESCGERMQGKASGKGTPRRRRIRYYAHSPRYQADRRGCRLVRADDIEAAVLDEVARVFARPDIVERTRRKIVEERTRGGTTETRRRGELQDELAMADRKARTLFARHVEGAVTAAQFAEWNAEIVARQAVIREELRKIEDLAFALGRGVDIGDLAATLADAKTTIGVLPPAIRKDLLFQLMREVRVTAREPRLTVSVTWRIPLVDQESSSAAATERPRDVAESRLKPPASAPRAKEVG